MTDVHSRPNRPYKLVEYSEDWNNVFTKYAEKIQKILGDNIVRIDHVGSTAIPGMIAKPQVDIGVEVNSLEDIKNAYDSFIKLGFTPRGDFIKKSEEYFTIDSKDGQREVSVHVMKTGNPELKDMLVLRDYLRSSPAARDTYIKYKRSLIDRFSANDYNSYSKEKRYFLEELKEKARKWNKEKLA